MSVFKRFPETFWVANTVELFERLAYYGMNIILALYLTQRVGFSDKEALSISGAFILFLYFLPTFSGAIADRIGFRKALIIAFLTLFSGYFLLAIFPVKIMAIVSLVFIAIGGSFVKPTISGSVAKLSPEGESKLGFAIFYMIVNIGGFLGKVIVKPMRLNIGSWLRESDFEAIKSYVKTLPPYSIDSPIVRGALEKMKGFSPLQVQDILQWQSFGMQVACTFSALMALVALTMVYFKFKDSSIQTGDKPSVKEVISGIVAVFKDVRFLLFILIFAGFEIMFWQLYLAMPLYIQREISPVAPMEWLVAINPGMIMIFQLPVAKLTSRLSSLKAMALGLSICIVSMIIMGNFPTMTGVIIAIMTFALGEMTFQPRFLEYVASIAPKDKIGLYLGFAHIKVAVGSFLGGWIAGMLVSKYCPVEGVRNPLMLWGSFAVIGLISLFAFFIYQKVFGSLHKNGVIV